MMLGAALSTLILGAAAIHMVEEGAKEDGGPHVMVRRVKGRAMSAGTPPQRVFVYGADTDDTLVKPRYHHIAKTGITSVMALIKAAISDTTRWERYPARSPAFAKQPTDFYIATIRNPCNYYVSLWAYNAEHNAAQIFKELGEEGKEFFGQLSESKDSADDIKKFRGFAKLVNGDIGVYTGRLAYGFVPGIYTTALEETNFSTRWLSPAKSEEVKQRLGDFNNSQVDCWVSTETLVEDMKVCMTMLAQDHGWSLNWEKFNATIGSLKKNPSNHKQCKDYYDEETEQYIRGKDGIVFDKFGFDACCDAGSSLATHLARQKSA